MRGSDPLPSTARMRLSLLTGAPVVTWAGALRGHTHTAHHVTRAPTPAPRSRQLEKIRPHPTRAGATLGQQELIDASERERRPLLDINTVTR